MAIKKIRSTLELIKFSHSVFALPFALASLLIATHGNPNMMMVFRIILALVFARTAAMAFNRLVDAKWDAQNPRTKDRHIPKGLLSRQYTATLVVFSAIGFVYVSFLLGTLCFWLSFPVLGILFFYSYTKRFSSYSQLFLGFALSMAPTGAWIAATNSYTWTPLALSLGVLFWVAGFDILYATQDYQFDKASGLHSLVVKLGVAKALQVARLFHAMAFIFFLITGDLALLSWIYYIGLSFMGILFIYQHLRVKPSDLSHINAAFFTSNGLISLIFLLTVYLSL